MNITGFSQSAEKGLFDTCFRSLLYEYSTTTTTVQLHCKEVFAAVLAVKHFNFRDIIPSRRSPFLAMFLQNPKCTYLLATFI